MPEYQQQGKKEHVPHYTVKIKCTKKPAKHLERYLTTQFWLHYKWNKLFNLWFPQEVLNFLVSVQFLNTFCERTLVAPYSVGKNRNPIEEGYVCTYIHMYWIQGKGPIAAS